MKGTIISMPDAGEYKKRRINITNIWVDPIDLDGAASVIAGLARERRNISITNVSTSNVSSSYVCTPNAEFMMVAQDDKPFMDIINGAELVVADGAGVVLAARLLGFGRIDRTTGFDLTKKLVTDPGSYPFSFYFLGGKPGVAEKAARNVTDGNPGVRVCGYHDGFFSEAEEPAIIDEINASCADILFVALGFPKAEKWIYLNREKLNVSVCMGVGGTLDILAGEVNPAPPFFRSHGLEWLYRLYREPWRAKRMLRLPRYVLHTIWWKLAGRPAPG